jgi:peptidoglycan/LPS O-acetylase OafA/YrhL
VTRVLLASAVLISHLSHYDIGRIAVIIFFFLSGYWTSRIWTEKFGERQFIRFYLARALRLYPLFLIITIASSLARGIPLSLENFLLIGIASTGNDPTNVSWSLDIEMQYYLLCPLLLPCLRRYPAVTIAAGALVAAAAWSVSSQWDVKTALLYLPAFLLGAVSDQTRNVPSTRTAWLSLGAFAVATAIVYCTPFFSKRMPEPFPRDLFALLWFVPLVPYLQRSLATRSNRLDRRLGEYSYAFYLVHFPIIALVVLDGTVLEKALATAISVGLAAVLFLVVDEPLNKVRYRLVKLTERRPVAQPPGLPV